MKKLGLCYFPETKDEADRWQPMRVNRGLAQRVLAVAQTRIEGAWSAYIDAVPGKRHDEESGAVLEHGQKLSEAVARAMFPMFDQIPYSE